MVHPEMIKSIAEVKKAAAIANKGAGTITPEIADAMVRACEEIIEGNFTEHFIVDSIQGGAGTSLNMNANEVIANRAIEILGGQKGNYNIVHPNDHVNCGQSTNDAYPSSGKLALIRLLGNVEDNGNALVLERVKSQGNSVAYNTLKEALERLTLADLRDDDRMHCKRHAARQASFTHSRPSSSSERMLYAIFCKYAP